MINKHTIDATGQSFGRVASKAASILMGKESASFSKNEVYQGFVTIINASKINIGEKKLKDKIYTKYSGYPGGLRSFSLGELITKKGIGEALKGAVRKMMPRNRLQVGRLKRLSVTE
jgi:large subunit ribosomal protein L13